MACVPSKGSIVSYEFLDSQTKWVWGVGTVTRSDDRVCVVEQWVGTLLDSTMTAEVEKEVAFSNAEAKAHQGRLLAIRERINLQGANTSKEEKENTSKELMQCLAVIGKHRSHSRSLLADLEKIKGPSGVPAKAQQFIPGSYSVTVLCSSVLEVISQTKKLSVFLSSEEIDSIENVVTHSRRHLNSELHQLRATVEAAEIESEALRQRVGELEEKLIFLENTSRPLQVCDGVGRRSARSEELQERQPLDFRRAWDDDASLVVTNHIFTFPWDNGDILLHHKPEETKFVLVAEAAFACCVPTQCVLNPKMTTSENHLSAEFSISHPNTMTATEVDQRLAAYTFPSLHRLHKEPLGAKIGLDRAIEDLENALGIPEGKHEGLFFDEFVETIQKDSLSGDKDAYESEIGDLLMLLDKLNNENRSLQYALDKSAAELKKQMEASQKDKDTLTTEIDRLRDITAKLKILAEQQEKELEIHRVHNRNAEQERLVHNLAPLEGGPGSPVYAVTLGEYTRQAKATEDAEEALEIAQTKSDELHQRLEEVEQQCAHQAEKLRELEIALETEKQTAAENSSALERELIDLVAQLKAQKGYAEALGHINEEQKKELCSFHTKRNTALAEREAHPAFRFPISSSSPTVASNMPSMPATTDEEPLYSVTLEEYRSRDAAVEQLTAELEEQRALAEMLAAEVAAFRMKRNAALEARDADGTLSVLGEPVSADEAAAHALEPQQIADEPLYAVTLGEYCDRGVAVEQLTAELEELRDKNSQMVRELEALSKRICDVVSAERETNPVREDLITQLEGLLRALEGAREAERAAFAVAEEKERELSQLRIVFTNEEERLNNDLEEAREEVKRLQGELDLLTDKLEEVYRLFGDADAANAEGVAKLEDLAEVLTAARVAERDIMDLLEAKESELAQFRSVLELRKDSENMLECLRDEVAQLHREKEITEMELGAAQKELNDLRYDLHAAEDKATEKAREVEGMTLDLEALNDRIRDLLEELQEKTDQYNQVIKDLDDFAKHQSHEDEKDLLQRLAVREQELFKLQEVRRGEISEHEKQVGMLQDQVDRLRDQTDQDNTLHKGLQDDLARLRKLLADANAALQDKTTENEALKDDIEGMIDEHESQMREMEQVLETKSQEVSDALGRLEEMTAMLQEAREGEESALRLRADSDAEVFRMQKELDRVKQLQSALSDSADDRGGLLAQLMDTEGQLRDAEAVIRRKDTELAESKELLKKLNKSEDLNYDLRRMLKLTMAALSKSKDTMSNSAGSLDVVRTELRPMLH